VAKLRKKDSFYPDQTTQQNTKHKERTPQHDKEQTLTSSERQSVMRYLEEYFGIDTEWLEPSVLTRINEHIWIKNEQYLLLKPLLKIDRMGLPLCKTIGDQYKISFPLALMLAHRATRRVISLDPVQAQRFIRGGLIPIAGDPASGQVLVTAVIANTTIPLGRGSLKDDTLKPQIPSEYVIRS
jgi:NOL1/NOP2/fmu family ribosome biogenesis protein